jgi:hypothetical protein
MSKYVIKVMSAKTPTWYRGLYVNNGNRIPEYTQELANAKRYATIEAAQADLDILQTPEVEDFRVVKLDLPGDVT